MIKRFFKIFLIVLFLNITTNIFSDSNNSSFVDLKSDKTSDKSKDYDFKDFKDASNIYLEDVNKENKATLKPLEPVNSLDQTVTSTYQPESNLNKIYLNFENTDLSNLINYMTEIKKVSFIPDKSTENVKVSLTMREPLTVDQAWDTFLTLLDAGGFAIIKDGIINKIVPKGNKNTQPLPSFINVPYQKLPDTDETIRYVIFLVNINASTISDFVKNMLSPEAMVLPYQDINGLIITEKSYNIKAAMRILTELDQIGLQEELVVIKLHQTNATDIKNLLEGLIKDSGSENPLARLIRQPMAEDSSIKFFSPSTKIIDEPRTNSLILLGDKKSLQKIEDFVTNTLDKELKGTKSPMHVYELQNTDATQMKSILETVLDPSAISAEAKKFGAVRAGIKYFKPMKFAVDKDGNRLIVFSTDKQDWKLLKKTIENLDKPQPQVALETLLVSVEIDSDKTFGGAIRNKFMGQIGKGINFESPTFNGTITNPSDSNTGSLLGNMINGLTYGYGSSILTFGKGENIWGIFKMLQSESNTSVLSQPFFVAANNTETKIKIGTEVNVQTQEGSSGFKGSTFRNAESTVIITPQINLDGIIRLNIKMDFSEFINQAKGNTETKHLDTDVSVADGQVLVLGGFVKTYVSENDAKTPLLGDIPVLGWMFKHKERINKKSYIFMFISPTIVKPRTLPGENLYTRMKLHEATDNIDAAIETGRSKDPIQNWFFNASGENYTHKVTDFAQARYQPTTVELKTDPYYSSKNQDDMKEEEQDIFAKEKLPVTPEFLAVDIDKNKRESFKNLLAENKETPEATKELININLKKRENFEDFIKPNEKKEKENSKNKTPKKRSMA